LIYSENDQVQLVLPLDFSLKQFFYAYLSEAIDFQILSYLFFHRDESTTKMMLELILSEASLFRRFKAINQLLKEFDIQL
ncbi:helix-turn-helix domain-containing protein, partial [Enterococcus faecalis]|nr:helix-turn-helix domain-containing protein [Enterococcus faecalis]